MTAKFCDAVYLFFVCLTGNCMPSLVSLTFFVAELSAFIRTDLIKRGSFSLNKYYILQLKTAA